MGDMHEFDGLLAVPLARKAGSDAVGYVGADMPVEALLASGRSFAHLPWAVAGDTPWADQGLESSLPHWSRSILEQWHSGEFDGLREVVFSRGDDASQRLFYYIRELQRRGQLRGPEPRIFDLALVPRESSLEHSARAVALLVRELGGDPSSLAEGIDRSNAVRDRLDALQRARSAHGPWFERLTRAALWNAPGEWLNRISPPVAGAADRPRLLLAGSVPPDGRLHEAVEAGGASVVAETHGHRLDRFGDAIAPGSEDPARAIARHIMRRSVGPRAHLDHAQWIVQQARGCRATAVVLWLTREDEGLAWQLPAQRAALQAAGIACLALPAAHWQADAGVREQVRVFCGDLTR
jgi:hypothetical protein